jgi:dTDP-4-dehydrorhamnose 3,5-epimerase-like enzyme
MHNDSVNLEFENEVDDVRGKIRFYSHGKMKINLIETKKGFARGGHYHKYEQDHILISGQVEVRYYDISTSQESIQTFKTPSIIHIPKNIAHLFIAVEDSIFIETSDSKYEVTNFPKYRQIVEERMTST